MEEAQDPLEHELRLVEVADELAPGERPAIVREEQPERRPPVVRQPQPRPDDVRRHGGAVDPRRDGERVDEGRAVDPSD